MRSLAALATLLLALPAAAFELKTDAEGDPVRWPDGRVELAVYEAPASLGLSRAETAAIVARALSAWNEALGGSVDLTLRPGEGAGEPGYRDAGPNENGVVFTEGAWAYDPEALAVAVVTVDVRRNAIVDADVIVNTASYAFADLDAAAVGGPNDLQGTITHELGHVLGLAHNPALPEAVMYPDSVAGEICKRALSDDDRDGVHFLYLGDVQVGLAREPAPVGCSAAAGGPPALLAALLLLPLLRRRVALVLLLVPSLAAAQVPTSTPAHARGPTSTPLSPLLARADAFVHGRVLRTRTFQAGSMLFTTESVVQVQACLSGRCAVREVTVRQPGGRIGDLQQLVEGATPLTAGEEVVLVLQNLPGSELFRVAGLDAGVIHVGREDGTVRLVRSTGEPVAPELLVLPETIRAPGR